jgi:hypothetical protein
MSKQECFKVDDTNIVPGNIDFFDKAISEEGISINVSDNIVADI